MDTLASPKDSRSGLFPSSIQEISADLPPLKVVVAVGEVIYGEGPLRKKKDESPETRENLTYEDGAKRRGGEGENDADGGTHDLHGVNEWEG